MNIRTGTNLLFADFNQDQSCISLGTANGYKIYNCVPFRKCFGKVDGGYGIVEMLFCTSLVVLVGAGDQPAMSPRRLQIINTKRRSMICELNFGSAILNVKLNRKRMAVVLETKIHLYDLSNLKLLHTLETAANPRGLCALAPTSESCYMAFPGADRTGPDGVVAGDVMLFDGLNVTPLHIIQAHKTGLSALAFNSDGTMLATSSNKGTVIRVWSIPDCAQKHQFRRGTYNANITSLSFDAATSSMLAVSSDTTTVHIFKLEAPPAAPAATGLMASFSSLTSYLPTAVSGLLDPERNFAHVKLPKAGVQNICCIYPADELVIVVTSDGMFYEYRLNVQAGGECTLLRSVNMMELNDDDDMDDLAANLNMGAGAAAPPEGEGLSRANSLAERPT